MYCEYQIFKEYKNVCLLVNRPLKRNEKGKFYRYCKRGEENMKRVFKMEILIYGLVDSSEEFSIEELNEHLNKHTNEYVKNELADMLDIPKDIITVSSTYK